MASRVRGCQLLAVMAGARAALCSVGLLALLAACSSAPPQAQRVAHASGVPVGFTEFRDSGRGYAIAVPASWIQVNVQSAKAAAIFAKVVKEKPQLAKLFGSNLASLAARNVSLLAIGPTGANANMIVGPGSGTLTAKQLDKAYSVDLSDYSRSGVKVLSHQIASLDGIPDLRIAITFNIGKVVLRETQFIAGVHGRAFILTISQATPTLTNQIAGTVRFL
jgi:hypothetical protein